MSMIISPYQFAVAGAPAGWAGSKAFSHQSTTTQVVSLTDVLDVGGLPLTLQQNDLVIITYAYAGPNVSAASMTPAGYTAAHVDLWADDSNDTNLLVSYKFMGSTPDTTVSIPAHANSFCVAGLITVLRGINTITPLDVAATVATGANSGLPNPPAITPVTPGALITCHGSSMGNGAANFVAPAGLSNFRTTFRTTAGLGNLSVGSGFATWASGAFDVANFTGGFNAGTSSWCAATIAWRPA
jgi:hypothetical protein